MNFHEFPKNFNWRACPKAFFSLKWSLFQAAIGGHAHWRACPKGFFSLKWYLFPGRPQGVHSDCPRPHSDCARPHSECAGPHSECPRHHSECPGSWDHSILASRRAGILGSESWHPSIPASQHPGILASSTLTQPQRLLHLNAYSTSTLIPLKTCIRVFDKEKI